MYNKRTLNKDTKASKEPKSISTPRDIIYDPMGQYNHPGKITRIPGGGIDMTNVPYPVMAYPNVGQPQMMYPEQNYNFPGADYVDEVPIIQSGGAIDLELTDEEIEEYRRGGYIVEEYAIGGEGGGEPTEPKPAFKKTEKFYDEVRELEEGRKLYKSYKEELLKLKRLKEKEEQDVRNKKQNILNIAQSLTENPRPTRTNLDYIAPSDYYCNTRSCEIFQDAGLTIPEGTEPFTVNKKVYKPGDQVPIIPGNMQMKGVLKNLGFLPVDESNLKPGDLAQEEVYKSRDYQGNTFSPRFVPSHSMIKANKNYYNAPGGDRTNYEITPISFYGEKGKDWRIQGYRYEGALPYYNNLLKDVQSKFEQYSQYADIPVEQLPIKRDAYLLNNLSKVPESILPSSTVDWQNKRKEEIKNSEFSSKEKRKLYKSFKQQGGTMPKFQTGDEKKPLPNLFNFDPTPEYVGYQGNVPVSESTRVANTYRPTQQEIKATKEYTQKVGATAQAIRKKTGVSQKEAMQQAEQVLDANSRVPSEAKAYANTKQAQERDAYVFDEGMNARDYFRYPLQFLSGNVPTQEERIQDRIRITDPRTSRLDKFMGTVGEAGSLAPEALLNTGIGLAFAPANLSKLGMVADAVSPVGAPNNLFKGVRAQNDILLEQARRSGEAPLPSYMEPYISRRYTPAAKEQDIFESFLSPEKQAELRQSRTQTFTPEGVNTPKQLPSSSVDDVGRSLNKNTKVRKTDSFKSEIDWGKWNKEIPENKALMQEYNAIEQTSKANGTWMKNPDGSAFQGTPEQFVQQNSKNFKKAFGNTKVTDRLGNPLILHHGSESGITGEFIPPKRRNYGNIPNTHNNMDYTFFHHDRDIAAEYAGNFNPGSPNNYKNVESVYINSKNPLIDRNVADPEKYIKNVNLKDYDIVSSRPLGKNYDFDKLEKFSIPYEESEIAVPYGNNVKSAIGNNGMFDMTNPNIYKALIPAAIGTGAAASSNEYKQGGMILDLSEDEIRKYLEGGYIVEEL